MSQFDPNYKRLKIIITIFVFLTVMYGLEWCCFVYFPSTQEPEPIYVIDIETMTRIDISKKYYENETLAKELGGEDFNFFGFMFFVLEEIPDWQKPLFVPISIIIWSIGLYLLIGWVYDWIKALPFT